MLVELTREANPSKGGKLIQPTKNTTWESLASLCSLEKQTRVMAAAEKRDSTSTQLCSRLTPSPVIDQIAQLCFCAHLFLYDIHPYHLDQLEPKYGCICICLENMKKRQSDMTRHRGHPLSLSCLIAEASRRAINLKVEIFAASAAALWSSLSVSHHSSF